LSSELAVVDKLLVTAAETSEISQLIESSLEPGSQTPIASGTAALEPIEKSQTEVFALTEKSLSSEKLQVGVEDANALICTVNDILEESIKGENVVEEE
jgi:hypothetical protein